MFFLGAAYLYISLQIFYWNFLIVEKILFCGKYFRRFFFSFQIVFALQNFAMIFFADNKKVLFSCLISDKLLLKKDPDRFVFGDNFED